MAKMLPFMFLSNNLSECNRDGYGSMSNLLRASVSLALHYNLTYVHHPLRCSHGVDWRVLDRWFDYGHGAPCDAACIDSAVASGGLREASHFFGCRDGATRCRVGSRRHTYRNLELSELDVRAGRNTTQARDVLAFGAIVARERARVAATGQGVVLRVGGCPRRYLVDAPVREWLQTRYEGARRRAGAVLAYEPRSVNLAIHYRSGDVKVRSDGSLAVVYDERLKRLQTGPAFYAAAVRQVVAWTRLPPSRVRVWLLTEGLIDTDEHVRDSNLLLAAFTTAIPGLNLKLGNMTTLPSDLDHLAQADVLLTANSGLSLVAASLARGVIVSQKDQTYIAGSLAGLKYGGTICARDGVCEQAGFLRAWGAFIADV